jgi:hypothetical protein
MYFPRNWEFGSTLSKPRNNFRGGGFEPTNPPPLWVRQCRQTHERPLHSPHVVVVCHFSTGNHWVMTVSLWTWTPNVITSCWKTFTYLRWDVATGIWRERGSSRTVPQPIRHDSQWTPYVLHSTGHSSLGLVTFSGPPIHRTLLQQTFFMEIFENLSFYSHPPWH